MSKNLLDRVLDREGAKQTPSVEDAVAMLTGKDNKRSIPKPAKKYTKEQKEERIAALKAERDGVDLDEPDEIPEIPKIDQIPEGFPEGTIMNDDQSLTLPDGRRIRKIQEAGNEEVS